jgi:hypothetical protein
MTEEKTFAASLGVEAYTAEELGFTIEGTYDKIPEDEKGEFLATEENIKNAAASQFAASLQRATAEGAGLEAGGPVIGGYEYVDIMCMSPRKRRLRPPWVNLPHKIVAGGERIVNRAILLINPLPGPGGTPTGRHVLGSRDVRVTFTLMNVTNGTPGPSASWTGSFSGLAPVVTNFYWFITHPDPGRTPHIYELNVMFDCLDPEQPYAAFATRWWDLDTDPGWPRRLPGPTVPTLRPGPRVQIPLRYMVFTE